LAKLKTKQFPLLYQNATKSSLGNLKLNEVKQSLCLLASLFIPYQTKEIFSSSYQKAICGYYLNFESFISLNKPSKSYYLPEKKEWGMIASQCKSWAKFDAIKNQLQESIREKQAILCWQKQDDSYASFFIVWW